MSHLTHFGLENFKVFKNQTDFEFRPITILTGTNSSGKSSLSKGILLAKEIFKDVPIESEANSWELNNNFKKLDFTFLEKLKIPNRLFGNMNHLINTDSNTTDSFSIIFPTNFPMLEELMLLKLTYISDGSNLNNGLLHDLTVFKASSNEKIIQLYNRKNEEGEYQWKGKVNFSGIYNLFIRDWKVAHKVAKAWEQCEAKLLEKNIGIDEKTDKQTYSLELEKKAHEELFKKIQTIYREFDIYLAPTSYMKKDFIKNIYVYPLHYRLHGIFTNPKEFISKYDFHKPLLNYTFLLNDKKLEDYYSDLNAKDMDEVKIKNKKKLAQLQYEYGDKWLAELINKELEWLDNIEFKSPNGYYVGMEIDIEQNLNSLINSIDENGYTVIMNNHIDLDRSTCYKISNELEAFIGGKEFYVEISDTEIVEIDWEEEAKKHGKNTDLIIGPGKIFKKDNQNFDILKHEIIYKGLKNIIGSLIKPFQNNHFLPSVRASVNRLYFHENQSELHQLIVLFQSNKIYQNALSFLEKSIKDFSIADSIGILSTPDSIGSRIYLIKGDKKEELADVGYGYSQLLPILLKIALIINEVKFEDHYFLEGKKYNYPACSLIIEEPETNLHPALQSKLADLFIECYKKYNIQFIIETHSEYLIRRLQYLIAKKEFSHEDANIYYFYPPDKVPDGEKQVKRIDILEDGRLSDEFGTGFFDEATNLMLSILTGGNLN